MKEKSLIIGLGQIGVGYDLLIKKEGFIYTHANALEAHASFDLIAGIDPSEENRRIFSNEYKKLTFKNIDEACKIIDPTTIIIASPTETHFEILREVLLKFKPRVILCEKPLSYKINEAEKMVEMCHKLNVNLFVNYMRVSDISAFEVKHQIEKNSSNMPIKGLVWYSKGFLHNGSHFFNLIEFWLGDVKSFRILNLKSTLDGDDVEIDVSVDFEKGTVIFLSAFGANFSHHSIELISSSGHLFHENGMDFLWRDITKHINLINYKSLNSVPKVLRNNMKKNQLNVYNELAKFFDGVSYNLCSGRQALKTITSMNEIIKKADLIK